MKKIFMHTELLQCYYTTLFASKLLPWCCLKNCMGRRDLEFNNSARERCKQTTDCLQKEGKKEKIRIISAHIKQTQSNDKNYNIFSNR